MEIASSEMLLEGQNLASHHIPHRAPSLCKRLRLNFHADMPAAHYPFTDGFDGYVNADKQHCTSMASINSLCCPSHRCMIFCGSAYIALVGDVERASLHAGIRYFPTNRPICSRV